MALSPLPEALSVPPTEPPQPTRGVARAMMVLIGIGLGLAAIELALMLAIPDWGAPDAPGHLAAPQMALDWSTSGVGLATVVVFCVWLYRTLANARDRHPFASINPGWTVGMFFIPVVHLFLPYFEIRRAWRADVSADSGPVTAWFLAWLAVLLVGYTTVIGFVVIAMSSLDEVLDPASDPETAIADLVEEMRPFTLGVAAASLVANAAAAYFLWRMSARWAAHQEGPPAS